MRCEIPYTLNNNSDPQHVVMHQFLFPFGRDAGLAEVLMASSTRSVRFVHAFHRGTEAHLQRYQQSPADILTKPCRDRYQQSPAEIPPKPCRETMKLLSHFPHFMTILGDPMICHNYTWFDYFCFHLASPRDGFSNPQPVCGSHLNCYLYFEVP